MAGLDRAVALDTADPGTAAGLDKVAAPDTAAPDTADLDKAAAPVAGRADPTVAVRSRSLPYAASPRFLSEDALPVPPVHYRRQHDISP
jgi:hypothetical protein